MTTQLAAAFRKQLEVAHERPAVVDQQVAVAAAVVELPVVLGERVAAAELPAVLGARAAAVLGRQAVVGYSVAAARLRLAAAVLGALAFVHSRLLH